MISNDIDGETLLDIDDEDLKTGSNPILKVVTMLQDMQKTVEDEGKKEEELFVHQLAVETAAPEARAQQPLAVAHGVEMAAPGAHAIALPMPASAQKKMSQNELTKPDSLGTGTGSGSPTSETSILDIL